MSEISLTEQPHLQEVQLASLDLQQLTLFKQQLNQSLAVLHDSLQSLRIAQVKFQESKDCLDKFTPDIQGKEVLVPLTGSMYVPGKLMEVDKVLIDIGTGYFAEKKVQEAKDYFKRRVSYVTEQIEKIQIMAQEKSKIREITLDIMEMKIQNLQAEGATAAQRTG